MRTRRGVLLANGGFEEQLVIIEGETPTRLRVRAVGCELRLPRHRNGMLIVLRSGTVLVPKAAVSEEPR